ncbi:hypothetical protein C3747_249g3 [Trypanosoma cruzi]|uniref:Uncharacterized protein n=2 Tax=Trypanosoma cruzi TaxID=5693 RepID=Q4DMT7_TRYCC|nr:hypothetical protein, conserved [Trypanosoma cruzi]EAN93842.1 hypothetical protein, conserved [Trypanosoma cruzi]PWU96860.1 hypothetical protein C3747_249g3 [Trypanosoma cruzi]|eukprot:XP_815693.1 hypothetical protein [Trypanosoma cruzi strain CL Brener]
MENVSDNHMNGGKGDDSLEDLYACDSLFDESGSEDDLFLAANVEEQLLMPFSCFTEKDLLSVFNVSAPYGDPVRLHPEEEPPKETRLEGPGVLRGVRIPSPKKKRETCTHRKNKSSTEKNTRPAGKRKEKPSNTSSNQTRRLRTKGFIKALTPDDLKDDEDYKR